jgi:hypothetical protein
MVYSLLTNPIAIPLSFLLFFLFFKNEMLKTMAPAIHTKEDNIKKMNQ